MAPRSQGQPESVGAQGQIQTPGGAALARIRRRLLPFIFLLYIAAYLDRINAGFAALQMNRELGLGDAAFGLGAGLFFVGYFLFEIPSNLILQRVGARRWIARIMISWGAAAAAMAAVRGPLSFYALRFLLGAAEAGFFPGIILYLTYWFPASQRAHAIALFMTASALAGVIGAPLSGALLMTDGAWGLAGWQWLFILEGLPSIILGVAVLFVLTDYPRGARWLTETEKQWLEESLAREDDSGREHGLLGGIVNRRIWMLALLYFAVVTGLYGVTMWLPRIVKDFGRLGNLQVGFISAIPFLSAAIAMVIVGKSSDRMGERRRHIALPAFCAAAGLILSARASNPVFAIAALSLAAAGIWGAMGPFWSMPSEYLDGSAAAAGIALINSVGNLGGFAGPYAMGLVMQRYHSFGLALAAMALLLFGAGCLALAIPRERSAI